MIRTSPPQVKSGSGCRGMSERSRIQGWGRGRGGMYPSSRLPSECDGKSCFCRMAPCVRQAGKFSPMQWRPLLLFGLACVELAAGSALFRGKGEERVLNAEAGGDAKTSAGRSAPEGNATKMEIGLDATVEPLGVDIETATVPAVQYRGVNLGGWLVLESWMYPDYWHDLNIPFWKGEWQVCELLGKQKFRKILEKHWDTWLTKDDLRKLSDMGIKHLRIPIGYWIVGYPYLQDDEQYVTGGWPYLLRALEWAKEFGMQAIIDLHAAPGRQNGHDNGGDTRPIEWQKPKNQQRTTDVLVYLAKNLTVVNQTEKYAGTILGLCLLNEPWTTPVKGPLSLDLVKAWVKTTTDAVIDAGWKGHIWFPDGFDLSWSGWNGFLQGDKYKHNFIVADTHIYMMFDPNLESANGYQQADHMCHGFYHDQLKKANTGNGVVVGEYSQDFPKYPSYPFGDGTKWTLRRLLLAQQQTFGVIGDQQGTAARGAFFWSFKSLGRTSDVDWQTNPWGKNVKDNHHSPWSYLAQIDDDIATDLRSAKYHC